MKNFAYTRKSSHPEVNLQLYRIHLWIKSPLCHFDSFNEVFLTSITVYKNYMHIHPYNEWMNFVCWCAWYVWHIEKGSRAAKKRQEKNMLMIIMEMENINVEYGNDEKHSLNVIKVWCWWTLYGDEWVLDYHCKC